MKKNSNEIVLNKKFYFIEKIFKKLRVVQLFALSFSLVIFVGSILLALPLSNQTGNVAYINHLFVATSAVCVTGLSPITVATQYTIFGKIVMIILMQIGGLGLMTFIAVIIMLRHKRMNLTETRVFASASGKSDFDDVPGFVRKIVIYTFFFEFLGFLFLCKPMMRDFGVAKGIFNAVFLSVSAFTNAGFDCIGDQSLIGYAVDPWLCIPVMLLIVIGGLGFVVWFELKEKIEYRIRKHYSLHGFWKNLSVHSKLVIMLTAFLISFGAIFFFINETWQGNTLQNMTFLQRLMVSVFQSITLRTAGFATVSIGACTQTVKFLMLLFMLIGGSPGGTAGGIKTTTFAILIQTIYSSLYGMGDSIRLFGRSVTFRHVRKALLITGIYIGYLFISICLLRMVSDNNFSFFALVFEAFSAIATVGLSFGITSELSVVAKIIIIALMFIGRVGPIAVLELVQKRKERLYGKHIQYPDAEILIG